MFDRWKFFVWRGASIAVLVSNLSIAHGDTVSTNQAASTNAATVAKASERKNPKTLSELLALPVEEVEKLDIGLLNLLCAEGLRGSEDLNVETSLRTLDILAEHVRTETERNRHYFQENPEKFKNSEGYFRMFYLATILQQDFGVRYNPARKDVFVEENGKMVRKQSDDVFFTDSKDSFIHGLLTHKHYGTCASMPVLYIAIAKRLGYPVFFATTQAHGYVRYEEGNGKHFNVEATCVGFKTYPDEFFKRWPFPVSDEEIKEAYHLQSLNNKIALGRFLIGRASSLTAAKKFDEAAEAWRQAMRYLPDTATFKKYAARAQDRAQSEAQKSKWFALWNDLGQMQIPDGERLSYFQNKRVRIQNLMANSADVDSMERAVNALKEEISAYNKQRLLARDSAAPVLIDVWPEISEAIEQEAIMPQVVRLKARVPELRSIPMEAIPPEYVWNGMPQELQERIRCLTKDGDIVEEMRTFQAEEMQMQTLATREAENRRRYLGSIQNPMWRPVRRQFGERFELKKFFRRPESVSIPYSYLNNAPPELEERIASLRFNSFDERERKVLDAIREHDMEQSQRRRMLHEIKQRRSLLQMEVERRRLPSTEPSLVSFPQTGFQSPLDVQYGARVWDGDWLRQETERRLSEMKSSVSGRAQSSLTPQWQLPINNQR